MLATVWRFDDGSVFDLLRQCSSEAQCHAGLDPASFPEKY